MDSIPSLWQQGFCVIHTVQKFIQTSTPSKHPYERRYLDKKGTERCKMAFSEIIAKDTRVPSTGKKVTCSGVPLFENQKSYTLKLYFTKKDNPTVIDDCYININNVFRIHQKPKHSMSHRFENMKKKIKTKPARTIQKLLLKKTNEV